MSDSLPVVLVPGLNGSARLYSAQIPALWRFGPVIVADHTRDDSMASIARRILADAPARFALAGLSMGGFNAFELFRQAPNRIVKIALLGTSARADTEERRARRDHSIGLARSGKLASTTEALYPMLVHRDRHGDADLKREVLAMSGDVGAGGVHAPRIGE